MMNRVSLRKVSIKYKYIFRFSLMLRDNDSFLRLVCIIRETFFKRNGRLFTKCRNTVMTFLTMINCMVACFFDYLMRKIVIMDWYMEKRTLRGAFIEWIGKGEVTRPIWQYLKPKVKDFKLDHSFNRGGVFVASGRK